MKKLIIMLLLFTFLPLLNSAVAQEVPDQLKERIRIYQTERDKIREELKLQFDAQEKLTLEQKNQLMNQWRNENADRIASQKSLALEIRTQLRTVIREKQSQLKDQPPEEREKAMQQWMNQNKNHLSFANGKEDMDDAIQQFRIKARKHIKQPQSDDEMQKRRLYKNPGAGSGKGSGNRGNS